MLGTSMLGASMLGASQWRQSRGGRGGNCLPLFKVGGGGALPPTFSSVVSPYMHIHVASKQPCKLTLIIVLY